MFAASIESWVIVSDSPVMVAYIIVFRVSFVEASVRMRVAISIVYLPVTIVARVWVVRMMITAVMVMVVIFNNVVMIYMVWSVVPAVPVVWVVSPVVWRVPVVPVWVPEPVVYNRTVDVNRLYDVVASVDVFVTDYLNRNVFGFNIFFYINRSNVLVDVFCKNGLYHDVVVAVFHRFNASEVVDVAVAIEVEVRNAYRFVVEFVFEVFNVFRFSEKRCSSLEVEIVCDFFACCRYRLCHRCDTHPEYQTS